MYDKNIIRKLYYRRVLYNNVIVYKIENIVKKTNYSIIVLKPIQT